MPNIDRNDENTTRYEQPGIALGEEKQGPSIDEQIEMLLNAWRLADMEAPVGPILASLIRLREIEGKLREPTAWLWKDDLTAPAIFDPPHPMDAHWWLPVYDLEALLLRGKP